MDGSLSAIDSPALALFNPPAQKHRPIPLAHAPRHFVARSVHNLRQGNFALFVVFCGCFIIFVRALFGAGYDEAFSADADAAVAKHPSLLQRWGPHSQHALEQQWQRLRGRAGDGLWAKIRKEDAGAGGASTLHQRAPGAEALHWLRVMEDKAMVGLGRRQQHTTDVVDEPADGATEKQAPVVHVVPEHDISEDLDEHDVPDEDDLRNLKKAATAKETPPTAPANADADDTQANADSDLNSNAAKHAEHDNVNVDVDADAEESESEQSTPAPPATAAAAEVDPEHDDTGDEPVYHSPDGEKK